LIRFAELAEAGPGRRPRTGSDAVEGIAGRYEQPDQQGIEISGLDVGMPVVGHVAMSLMADLRSSLKFRRVMSLR
jgi:hypothetical protein